VVLEVDESGRAKSCQDLNRCFMLFGGSPVEEEGEVYELETGISVWCQIL
jgi:hypothetical protein